MTSLDNNKLTIAYTFANKATDLEMPSVIANKIIPKIH